jgi:hypothetical protein
MNYNHYRALSGPSYMTSTSFAKLCRESVVFGRLRPCRIEYRTTGSSHRH